MIHTDHQFPSYEHRMTQIHLRFIRSFSPNTLPELEKIADFGYLALYRASILLIDLKAACERSNDCNAVINVEEFKQDFPAAVSHLNRAMACFRQDWQASHNNQAQASE